MYDLQCITFRICLYQMIAHSKSNLWRWSQFGIKPEMHCQHRKFWPVCAECDTINKRFYFLCGRTMSHQTSDSDQWSHLTHTQRNVCQSIAFWGCPVFRSVQKSEFTFRNCVFLTSATCFTSSCCIDYIYSSVRKGYHIWAKLGHKKLIGICSIILCLCRNCNLIHLKRCEIYEYHERSLP